MRRASIFVLMLLAVCPALEARNREAARKAYGKASEYHSWLKELPASRRSQDRFPRWCLGYSYQCHSHRYSHCQRCIVNCCAASSDNGESA